MKKMVQRNIFALLAVLLVAGCSTLPRRAENVPPYRPAVDSLDVSIAQPDSADPANQAGQNAAGIDEPALRTLLPGDRIVITLRVFPKAEQFETVIDETGAINLDLVGRVRISGKSAAEAERIIEKAYIDAQFYKTITVSIIPPEREFFVKGYVIRPGNYPITRAKMTVLQALTMAGGWNEFADPSKVRLVRGEEIMVLNIPRIQQREDPDVFIEPGDVIDVPKRWM